MKIPERRPGTEPEPGPGPGSGTWQREKIVASFAYKLLFAGEIETIHAFRLPLLLCLSLSLTLSFSLSFAFFWFFIWNIFRIRCNWRINFVRFDASTKKKMLNSLQVSVLLSHSTTLSLSLSLYPSPSLSGTATICISIFEHLNINESPQQLQIAVGNSIPRNVGY